MKDREDIGSLKLTLGLYVAIFAMKIAAYWVSGVVALLAEGLHTLSDIFISAFLLVAAWYSGRAADRVHMFGYGRAQNVAALVAATLFVSFTSFELYREAIARLAAHESATFQNLPLAIGVLVVSMIIAAAPLVKLVRQKTRGAAARAQMIELVNDELGLLAALAGTLLVVAGEPLGDPLAAILIATIIAVNAVRLFRENVSMLLGQAPPPEFMASIETAARSVAGVTGVHDLRAEFIGPGVVHADLHVEVSSALSVVEGHRIAKTVDAVVTPMLGPGVCEVHVDPV
jgi:ferrous-iron efflux pump FieF